MCIRAELNDLNKDMPVPLFEEIVSQFGGYEMLNASGIGEPLLHPHISEMVNFANEYLPVTFVTNGTLLKGKMLDKVASMPLAEMSCSVHSASPKTHREIMPGADLNAVLKGLKYLTKNASFPIKIKTTVMSSSIHTLYRLPQLLASHDIGHMDLYPVVGFTDFAKDRRLPRVREHYKKFHNRMVALARESGIKLGPMNEALYLDECYAPWFDALITHRGNLAPCCKLMEMPMGDGRNFDEAWNGPKMREWRRRLAKNDPPHPHCRNVCVKYGGPK